MITKQNKKKKKKMINALKYQIARTTRTTVKSNRKRSNRNSFWKHCNTQTQTIQNASSYYSIIVPLLSFCSVYSIVEVCFYLRLMFSFAGQQRQQQPQWQQNTIYSSFNRILYGTDKNHTHKVLNNHLSILFDNNFIRKVFECQSWMNSANNEWYKTTAVCQMFRLPLHNKFY